MDHYVVIIGIFSGDRCRSLQHLGTKYLKGGKQITSPAKKTRITCFIFEERAFILNRHTKIEAHTLHTPHKNVCRTHVTLCYTSITLLHLKSDTQRSIVIHTFIYFTASLSALTTIPEYNTDTSSLCRLVAENVICSKDERQSLCFLSEVRRSNPGQFLWFQ